MPFDAEDLKKAKAEINSTMGQTTILGTREMAHMFPEKLQDLLARLEAAEAYIASRPEDVTDENCRLYKEWQKAAGK